MTMQTIDATAHEQTVMSIVATDSHVPSAGNYGAVRFNAVKHGILSSLVVMPYEDADEFAALLAALEEEHRPAGMTEQHLVEELASIIWRKRRVLLAEGAEINRALRGVVKHTANGSISAAVPFERGISGEGDDIRRAMLFSPERADEDYQETKSELRGLRKAQNILRKAGANAYAKARQALQVDSKDAWDELVDGGHVLPDAASLSAFLQDTLAPVLEGMEKNARYRPAIKAQVLGDGLQAHKLEPLSRYETTLDRKFERTLAMLLKMKELRRG